MRRLDVPSSMLLVGVLSYCLVLYPFSSYMSTKPIEEKLGYVPSIKLLKPLSADQKELVGASLVMKTVMYFGGTTGEIQGNKIITEPVDLAGMSRLLHGAVQLDPYNMDAYYFAQSFLTWDAKQFSIANALLDCGMQYRTWDWQLPFFAGFNNAYFLKNYAKAADYYRRAAELSGQDWHKNLAGRYLQESGQTGMAIAYLNAMLKTATHFSVRQNYEIRLKAFLELQKIEEARDRFKQERGSLPKSVDQLLRTGYLQTVPVDPYGGRFYLEPTGKIITTSKFAFSPQHN